MSGELSRGLARWKYNTGEDAGYPQIDEKTLEALLQLGIEHTVLVRSIGGRGYVQDLGPVILNSEIPLSTIVCSNPYGKNVKEQYLAGSFAGAAPS